MAARKALDEQHRQRQQALQQRVAGGLGVLLAAMPSLDEQALAGYVDGAYPVVAGGQRAAADTAAGYGWLVAAQARRHRKLRPVDVDAALATSDVLVTPQSPSLVAPVLRARALVADGELPAAAMRAAASYAHALSSNDMQAAQRVGLDEGVAASGARVIGYRKDVAPDCCDWCELVGADRVYKSADSVPFHDRDHCGVSPVLEGED